jgi:truncated hemoglobin YjbI
MSQKTLFEETEMDGVLERFMKEFFPYSELKKIGLFTKEMRKDYKAQAKRVCDWLGYDSIYEYGAEEIRMHVSYPRVGEQKDDPFITVIPSIYESEPLKHYVPNEVNRTA